MTSLTRVRVHKIESIRDPDGNLGKRVELIEDRVVPRFVVRPASEEARMVQEVVRSLQQQLPVLAPGGQLALPKLVLFLTERECEELGIVFDVNQVYELELADGTVRFRKVS